MSENLIYRQEAAIATIQLHRPEKKNALNFKLRQELTELLNKLAVDKSIRVVILTGGEEFFCAGADITEIKESTSAEAAYERAREYQVLFGLVEALPQPVIGAVSGFAFGGGCELVLVCDFLIVSETAKLGLTEVRIGAIPGGGGTQRLPRLIGAAKAKEMILTGDPINAEQALAVGLAMKVTPKGMLLEEATRFALRLADSPRLALQAAKMLINRGPETDLTSALELEARCAGALGATHDFQEGTRAFLEKRKPIFTGN